MIAFGHCWSDIQDYSLGQIKIFLRSAARLEKERRAMMISGLRLAAWGKDETVEKIVNSLGSFD